MTDIEREALCNEIDFRKKIGIRRKEKQSST